jgi:hypothetical protein
MNTTFRCAIVLAAASCGALTACTEPEADPIGTFSTELGQHLHQRNVSYVDLARIGSKSWDALFLFGPYSSRAHMCDALALSWLRCQFTMPSDVPEGLYLLVFRASDGLRPEWHARSNGDFYAPENSVPQPILPSAARFAVVPTAQLTPNGHQWLRLAYRKP